MIFLYDITIDGWHVHFLLSLLHSQCTLWNINVMMQSLIHNNSFKKKHPFAPSLEATANGQDCTGV